MSSMKSSLSVARAARRALHVDQDAVDAASCSRRLRRNARFRLVSVGLVIVLVAGSAVPAARGQIDSPVAWEVVAKMSALVGQMISIKQNVSQQRDQMRMKFMGKLAPLTSKLSVVNCFLSSVVRANPASAIPGCTGSRLPGAPGDYHDVTLNGEDVRFNDTEEVCGPGVTGAICHDEAVPLADLTQGAGHLQASLNSVYGNATWYPAGPPAHVVSRHARQQAALADTALVMEIQEQRFDDRIRYRRAAIDGAMSIVEEWRGCQPLPDGAVIDGGDPRLPCVTNEGIGRDSGNGTTGMLEELGVMLRFVREQQEGDASLEQLSTMGTQIRIMQARIMAARVEMDAVLTEQRQEDDLQNQAFLRRNQVLAGLRLDCLDGRSGQPASPFNRFVPNYSAVAGGVCLPGTTP